MRRRRKAIIQQYIPYSEAFLYGKKGDVSPATTRQPIQDCSLSAQAYLPLLVQHQLGHTLQQRRLPAPAAALEHEYFPLVDIEVEVLRKRESAGKRRDYVAPACLEDRLARVCAEGEVAHGEEACHCSWWSRGDGSWMDGYTHSETTMFYDASSDRANEPRGDEAKSVSHAPISPVPSPYHPGSSIPYHTCSASPFRRRRHPPAPWPPARACTKTASASSAGSPSASSSHATSTRWQPSAAQACNRRSTPRSRRVRCTMTLSCWTDGLLG